MMNKIFTEKIYLRLILLLGTTLRIFNLGKNSLWSDEAGFMQFRMGGILDSLKYSWSRIILAKADMGTPAFSFFAAFWSNLVQGEFMLRLSSAIVGIVCILLIYQLGKILFGYKVGIISAFLLALSPFHIYYSQEFRMYSLITLLSIASTIFLVKFLETEKKRFLFGYVISHIWNIYFHITTSLILFAHVIYFIIYKKKYRYLLKKWLIGHLIIIVSLLPEIVLIISSVKQNSWNYFTSTTISTVSELGSTSAIIPFYTFKNFCVGYNATASIWLPASLLFFMLVIFAVIKTNNKRILHICLLCFLIPISVMYAAQKFIYADRFLISSSVFLYLIAGNGIYLLKRPFLVFAMISIFCFFSLVNYYKDYLPGALEQRIAVHSKKSHREAAIYLLNNFQEDDIIFHTQPNTSLPLQYYFNYFREDKRNYSLDKYPYTLILRFSEGDREEEELLPTEIWAKDMPYRVDRSDVVSVKGHKRVWLVFSAREFNQALYPNSYEQRILRWLDKHYRKKDIKYFRGIYLYLYVL